MDNFELMAIIEDLAKPYRFDISWNISNLINTELSVIDHVVMGRHIFMWLEKQHNAKVSISGGRVKLKTINGFPIFIDDRKSDMYINFWYSNESL